MFNKTAFKHALSFGVNGVLVWGMDGFTSIERFSVACRRLTAFALVLHCFPLWLASKTRATFSTKWEAKPITIATCTRASFRALRQLRVIASHSDWFVRWFASLVISQNDYFGLAVRHSFENRDLVGKLNAENIRAVCSASTFPGKWKNLGTWLLVQLGEHRTAEPEIVGSSPSLDQKLGS